MIVRSGPFSDLVDVALVDRAPPGLREDDAPLLFDFPRGDSIHRLERPGDDVHAHHHPRSAPEGHVVYAAARSVLLEVEAAVADGTTLDRPADDADAQSGIYHGGEHAEHVDGLHGLSLPADG